MPKSIKMLKLVAVTKIMRIFARQIINYLKAI